ncbi:MAG TPA: hypothetical protein VK802_04690 [Streptosporangiaceae bacterium]|nr:hypothetical protein [Streptosporangiaceae bacterium]
MGVRRGGSAGRRPGPDRLRARRGAAAGHQAGAGDRRAHCAGVGAEGVAAFLEKRPANWTLAPSTDLPDWFPWRPEPPFAE